ncbi:hypothetical protein LZ30DRAFT_60178 [Colletotrichum cereale]|nr:hypothetical protein LZ30DRAFT_60178 [Colletotrichum cereale]
MEVEFAGDPRGTRYDAVLCPKAGKSTQQTKRAMGGFTVMYDMPLPALRMTGSHARRSDLDTIVRPERAPRSCQMYGYSNRRHANLAMGRQPQACMPRKPLLRDGVAVESLVHSRGRRQPRLEVCLAGGEAERCNKGAHARGTEDALARLYLVPCRQQIDLCPIWPWAGLGGRGLIGPVKRARIGRVPVEDWR